MPATQYHLGRALLFQGRNQEATKAFQRAGELGSPFFADLGMAQVSLAQGNHDEALSYLFKRVKRGEGENAINHYWLSAAYAIDRAATATSEADPGPGR